MIELVTNTTLVQLDKVGRPDIHLKLECNQFANSFKTRGIVSSLERESYEGGVATFTTGNHGISLAAIAKKLGFQASVFTTQSISDYKRHIIESFGAKVHLLDTYDLEQATTITKKIAEEQSLTFLPLFGNDYLFEGYSSIAEEIYEILNQPVAMFFPIGSGSLLLANARTAKSINTANKVFGVESKVFRRIGQQKPLNCASNSVADSLSLNRIPSCNAELFRYVDKFMTSSKEDIIAAMGIIYKLFGIMPEAGGAITLSAALKTPISEQVKVAVITGKNISEVKFASLTAQTSFQMKPHIQKYNDYQSNNAIISEIREIIAPSYKNAGSHIEHDIETCNELYVVKAQDGQMLAFFMVGYHEIDNYPCCYLGLSTCRQEYKNSGFVKALYLEFAKDCVKKELDINKRIISYWTTATPIVYHWFSKYFTGVQPDREGNCTTEGLDLLLTIASKKYSKAQFSPQMPFVLRGAAQGINYSDEERTRIGQAIKDLNLTVFDKHQLDETRGDRFLMYGYTPSHERLMELTQYSIIMD